MSADPAVALDVPAENFINDGFEFTATFDNAGDGIGYKPFIDVTVGPGIDVSGANYLGRAVDIEEVATYDAAGGGWVDAAGDPVTEHPLDPSLALPAAAEDGATWLRVDLPFGSYGPDQPALPIVFTAELDQAQGAVVGTPIDVTARGGFEFGADPLDNPSTDPPIQQPGAVVDPITPTVVELSKAIDAPEGEIPQGPNWTFTTRITIDIAEGQTLTDLRIDDVLPDNLQFLPGATVTILDGGANILDRLLPLGPPSPTRPDAFVLIDSVTGTASAADIVIAYTAFAPRLDAFGNPIIDPVNPRPATATDTATLAAGYDRDGDGTPDVTLADSAEATVTIKPFSVLKSVSVEGGGPAIPGAYLKFQVQFGVSDFLSFDDIVVDDVLSNGLLLDLDPTLAHVPTFTIFFNGVTRSYDVQLTPPSGDLQELEAGFDANGGNTLKFFLSNVLLNNDLDGTAPGDDLITGPAPGQPTRGVLTYFAQIQETYRPPLGGTPVVTNDALGNSVIANANAVGGGASSPDGSSSGVNVPSPQPDKSIYAIKGDTSFTSVEIAPGNDVTYRIRIELATADIRNLDIKDYLPSPVFDVDGNGSGFIFAAGGGLPAPYQVRIGPDDTLAALYGVPIVSIDAAANALLIDFIDFDRAPSSGGVIDLLYTITATDRPFGDGLRLTNQAVISAGDHDSLVASTTIETDEVVLRQPVLSIVKGAVATDAAAPSFDPSSVGPTGVDFGGPGSIGFTGAITSAGLAFSPIDSDLAGFDAGDLVKFAIVVENTGGRDGFDLTLTDLLPAGFELPAGAGTIADRIGLDVRLGRNAGAADVLAFTGDLFNSPLAINDGSGIGAIAASGDDGANIIIVTYTLRVGDDYRPGVATANLGTLTNFAAIENGSNFTIGVAGDFDDDARLTGALPAVDKTLVTTSLGNDASPAVTIGEIATFRVTVTLPDGFSPTDGSPGLLIQDVVPGGFELIGSPVLRLGSFAGELQQGSGAVGDGALLTASQAGVGAPILIAFSSARATAGPGTTDNSFTIEYQVRLNDVPAIVHDVTGANSVTADTPTTAPTPPAIVDLRVVEPRLEVEKSFVPAAGDGGDAILMTITLTSNRSTPAFGPGFVDTDLDPSVFSSVTLVSADPRFAAPVIDPTTFDIAVTSNPTLGLPPGGPGSTAQFVFELTIRPDVIAGISLTNTARATYSSLPGDLPPPEERPYTASGGAVLEIDSIALLKRIETTSLRDDASPNVVAGEEVTFEVKARLPEGEEPVLTITDDVLSSVFPNVMMELTGASIVRVGTNISVGSGGGTLDPTPAFSDTNGDLIFDQVVFAFGDLVNNPDGGTGLGREDEIVIRVTTRVLNRLEVQQDVPHDNVATAEIVPPDLQIATARTVIVEPDLVVDKVADVGIVDAGDRINYQIFIRHDPTSKAAAFDVDLTDTLSSFLALDRSTIIVSDPSVLIGGTGNTITLSGLDLELGEFLVVTYAATVLDTITPGTALDNTTIVTWTSLPGVVAGERTGADGVGGALNDYAAEDTVTILAREATGIEKRDGKASSAYTIGEEVTYRVRFELIEGTTNNARLVDQIPADLIPPAGASIVASRVDANGATTDPLTTSFDAIAGLLTIDFGRIVNPGDNDVSNDFIEVTYQVQMANLLGNVSGAILTNIVTFSADGAVSDTTTHDIRVIEPELDIVKTNDATVPPDAGDMVTFTITVDYTGDIETSAYDVEFRDAADPAFRINAITSISGVADASIANFGITGGGAGIETTTPFDILPGERLVLVYEASVRNGVAAGASLLNSASVTWTSLPGEIRPGAIDGERTGTLGRDENDYLRGTSSTVTIANDLELTKRIIGSSVPSTPDTLLAGNRFSLAAIGERMDYEIRLTFIEGVTENVVLDDTSAAGLSIDPASVTLDTSGFNGTNASFITDLFDRPEGGQNLTIRLGQVTNLGDDSLANDTIVIRYSATVANVARNVEGRTLPDTAVASATSVVSDPDTVRVVVVEPKLTLDKELVTPPALVDAGDTLAYRVTIGHGALSGSDAFDSIFADAAPPSTLIVPGSLVVGGSGTGTFTIRADGSGIDGRFDLVRDQTITLNYRAVVQDSVTPGVALTNASALTWTSTPGTNSAERTGADGPGGALNNYALIDSTSIAVRALLTLDKAVVASSVPSTPDGTATIGETVTFALDVTLGEGTSPDVRLADLLAPGTRLVPGSVTVTPPAGTTTGFDPANVSYDPVTNELIVPLGNVTVTGTGAIGSQIVRVTYVLVVENVLANQDGLVLVNNAAATSDGLSDTASSSMQLVEPELTLEKDLVDPPTAVDAGDLLTYRITIAHSGASTSDAFDAIFVDAAARDTLIVPGSLRISGTGTGTFTIRPDGSGIDGTFDLSRTQTITLDYEGVIQDSVTATATLTNDADLIWTSTPSANPDERTGVQGPGGLLDNYARTDSATIGGRGVVGLVLDKSVIASSVPTTPDVTVTIGEHVTFALDVTLAEGTSPNVQIMDVLAPGTRFVPGSVTIVTPPGVATGFDPFNVRFDPSSNRLEIPLGDVVVPGTPGVGFQIVRLTYDTIVENVVGNSAGIVLTNNATATSLGLSDTATASLLVVEPSLTVSKFPDAFVAGLSETVTYTVRVNNLRATSDAFDVLIEEALTDPKLTLAPGPVIVTDAAGGVPVADGLVVTKIGAGFRLTIDRLPTTTNLVITYRAVIGTEADFVGQSAVNTVDLTWTSTPGANPNERDGSGGPAGVPNNYADAFSAPVTIAGPDLKVEKTASVPLVRPGDPVTFTIEVTNVGVKDIALGDAEAARDVVLTDILPDGLDLLEVRVAGVVTTVVPDSQGRITLALGTIAADASVTVEIDMRLPTPAPAGIDLTGGDSILLNLAAATHAQFEPTPANNVDRAAVALIAQPDLTVTKDNFIDLVQPGQTVTFAIDVANLGDQIASGVLVIDDVDTAIFDFVAASNGGIFDAVAGTVTWSLDRLSPVDGAVPLTLTLKAKPAFEAGLTQTLNVITIKDDGRSGADANLANNIDDDLDNLTADIDLAVAKDNFITVVERGDAVTFRIEVENLGDRVASGVLVVDDVDTIVFDFVSASDGGTFDAIAGTVTWRLDRLSPAEGTVTLTLELRARQAIAGEVTQTLNVVTVTDDGTQGPDRNLANNRATDLDTVNATVIPSPVIPSPEIPSFLEPDPPLDERLGFLDLPDDRDPRRLPLLTIEPILTGLTEPGASVRVVLIGADGIELAQQIAVSDTAGSWIVSLPGATGPDQPVQVRVFVQPGATQNDSFVSNRAFFSPASGSPFMITREFTIFEVDDAQASRSLRAAIEAVNNPGLRLTSQPYVSFLQVGSSSVAQP